MALTALQREARKGKLTASSVGVLMEGKEEEILNLYYELTDDPRYEPKQLDDVWQVQLGSYTEIFSLHWYSRTMGYGPLVKSATITTDEKGNLFIDDIVTFQDNPIKKIGEIVVHPQYPWAAATLDAQDTKNEMGLMTLECKHCGNHRKEDDVLAKYMPQVHWQMFCTGTKKIFLRVIIGSGEPQNWLVEWNGVYWATLWHRAQKFWQQVQNKTPPSGGKAVAAPLVANTTEIVMRQIDLTKPAPAGEEHPNWAGEMCSQLDVWLESIEAAKLADKATAKVKELLPTDVNLVRHEGVEVKRNKAGSVSISKA